MERCCPVSALRSTARLLGVISDRDIMTSYKPNIANALRPIHCAAAEASLCVLSGITVIKFLNNFGSSVSQQKCSLYNLYWRVWWAPFLTSQFTISYSSARPELAGQVVIKLTFLWSATQKPPFNCSIIYWLCLNSIVTKLDEEIWDKALWRLIWILI